MKVYFYDPVTRRPTREGQAVLDKRYREMTGKTRYIMPAHCTTKKPPKQVALGKVVNWDGNNWIIVDLPEAEKKKVLAQFEEDASKERWKAYADYHIMRSTEKLNLQKDNLQDHVNKRVAEIRAEFDRQFEPIRAQIDATHLQSRQLEQSELSVLGQQRFKELLAMPEGIPTRDIMPIELRQQFVLPSASQVFNFDFGAALYPWRNQAQ